MGFYKKTILLSNQDSYEKGMAVLTLEKNNSGIFGSIKSFNVDNLINLVLGISVDGKAVTKQNVTFQNGNVFSFKLNNDLNINGKIGAVLAEVDKQNVKVLVWGANGAVAKYKDDIIHNFKADFLNKSKTMQNDEITPNKAIKLDNEYQKDNEEDLKIEDVLKNDSNIKIERNVQDYSPQLFESSEDEVEEIIDGELNKDKGFFGLIDNQINELFDRFPEDGYLSSVIPNSKWVKVDYDNDGKEYVLGMIYESGEVKYICYGVPSKYDTKPPEELIPYSQWMSVNGDEGYWIMYQDALTGESVLLEEA